MDRPTHGQEIRQTGRQTEGLKKGQMVGQIDREIDRWMRDGKSKKQTDR